MVQMLGIPCDISLSIIQVSIIQVGHCLELQVGFGSLCGVVATTDTQGSPGTGDSEDPGDPPLGLHSRAAYHLFQLLTSSP